MKRAGNRDDQPAAEQGFVLIAVAGILLLLAAISSALLLASQTNLKARQARNALAHVSVFADGMVRLTAYRLARARTAVPTAPAFPHDGSAMWCREGALLAEVRAFDTAGLVDLNFAPIETLEALLRGVGVPNPEAAGLAAAIMDFRDADEAPSVGGAETLEYRQAGRPYGPKNAAFESVDELDQVLGMSPELLERLRPLVTVHSRSPAIDFNVSPPALLEVLSIGGSTAALAASRDPRSSPTIAGRRVGLRGSRNRLPVMIVRVVVRAPSGAAFMREATIELTSQVAAGFTYKDWTSRPVPRVQGALTPVAADTCLN